MQPSKCFQMTHKTSFHLSCYVSLVQRQECSLVASSPSGCHKENPLQAQLRILEMNDSSQTWSMKWSLLVFVYIKAPSCLMSQNPNKLAASSDKLSSLRKPRWCEESRPVRLHRRHMERGEASWQCAPKNVTRRVNHRVACPESLRFLLLLLLLSFTSLV